MGSVVDCVCEGDGKEILQNLCSRKLENLVVRESEYRAAGIREAPPLIICCDLVVKALLSLMQIRHHVNVDSYRAIGQTVLLQQREHLRLHIEDVDSVADFQCAL